MTLNKLYGLKKYFLNLTQLFETNKLPKVLMFTGKKGQGKFTLTHHLIAFIFDKNNYDLSDGSIKEKNILNNNIKENYNPNVIYFNCSNNNVKIDDIRNLRLNLQKSSINSMNRYIIFDDVECLNENCVNALLKNIEEPSDTNFFILINNQSKIILDTLKSRAIEIMFFLNNAEKIDIIKQLLKDYPIEEKIELANTTLTPGNYLKYNKIILNDKIDVNNDLIFNIEKLLRLNKLRKNIDYVNFAIYLINEHFIDKSKKKLNISYYNNRINIIKKLHEMSKLNLNQANLILEIENYI